MKWVLPPLTWVVVMINHHYGYEAFFPHFKAPYKYKLIKIIITVTITEKGLRLSKTLYIKCVQQHKSSVHFSSRLEGSGGKNEEKHCVRAGISKRCLWKAKCSVSSAFVVVRTSQHLHSALRAPEQLQAEDKRWDIPPSLQSFCCKHQNLNFV